MNEEKYTQKALSALQEAQNNALAENHQEIKEEHLLCALLADNGLIGGFFEFFIRLFARI